MAENTASAPILLPSAQDMHDSSVSGISAEEAAHRDSVVVHHENDRSTTISEDQRRVILVAVDTSEHSVNAFNWALKNFLRKETDLVVLVNVRVPSNVPGPYGMSGHFTGAAYVDYTDVLGRLEDHARKSAHSLLQKYGEVLKGKGYECKAIAIRGDPRYDIVRKAHELKVEAVIMGSRGMGAIKRTILGSVSDYCVHHLPMPVIIVKMQNEKAMSAPEQ